MRVIYLFTTYPKLSERFFLREVQALRELGLELEVYSMIGGQKMPEAGAVRHFKASDWLLALPGSLYWFFRKPLICLGLLRFLSPWSYRSWINYGENLLGMAFAFRFARKFASHDVCLHGAWATAPGMAAYALHALAGLPYTLEAHAYDLYRCGGDAWLSRKFSLARSIRSSTESATSEVRRLTAHASKPVPAVYCVRRGLSRIPPYTRRSFERCRPLRILSVGRLIDKKGYVAQLELFSAMKACGIDFEAKIIGSGPLGPQLKSRRKRLGLRAELELSGQLEHAAVEAAYQAADVFLFYGRVSQTGDRDGFPNVIGEAMSFGLPVFSTDVAGIPEVIRDGQSGFLLDGRDYEQDALKIRATHEDVGAMQRVSAAAHAWVRRHFSVSSNALTLKQVLWDR